MSNQVTQSAFDPISREPNYKQCAVRVKASGRAGGAADEQQAGRRRQRHGGRRLRGADPASTRRSSTSRSSATRRTSTTTASCSRRCSPARRPPTTSPSTRSTGISSNDIDLRLGVRIVDVDADAKTVTGDDGSVTPYDKLLLATGSQRAGCRRSRASTRRASSRSARSTTPAACCERAGPGVKAVVIGGGLLGLEAARGLQVQGCDVTVVHLMDTLMERQLDPTGGGYLTAQDGGPRHQVLLGARHDGDSRQRARRRRGVRRTASMLEADLVVVAAGIRPNVELGRKAGLHVNRGIVVNDYMETSRSATSSRSASASSTTASATAWSRRCSSRARCWRRPSPATRARRYTGTVHGGEAQDHGRRCLLGRRLERDRAAPSRCATKIARSASTRS